MARPRKTGLEYFPHDTSASHDTKIMALESEHGLEGYAFFFKLLEILYAEGGLDFSKKATRGACVKAIGIGAERFDELLDAVIEYELFDAETYRESGVLTSESIQKRMNAVNSRRVSATETQQKPNGNYAECGVSVEYPHGFPSRESKEKKSKEKKTPQDVSAREDGGGDDMDLRDEVPDEDTRQFREVLAATQECGWRLPDRRDEQAATDCIEEHGAQATIQAIRRAHDRGRRSWGYVKGILEDWRAKGYVDDPTPNAQSPPGADGQPKNPVLSDDDHRRIEEMISRAAETG